MFCEKYFPMSCLDWIKMLFIIIVTSSLCLALQHFSDSDFHVPLIFVLAVLVISLITNGYFFGIFSAFISVFAVNWAFTYPYFVMDFSLYGYPLTFVTMLTVGIATSTLTSIMKEKERIYRESEKEKMRANLLRAISHDLRTPLTSISGTISAVIDNEDIIHVDERNELLSDAKQEAEWLCRMVENLLSITRISGEEIQNIHKEEEILEEVLSEAVINFKKKNPSIDVSVIVPNDLVFVPMDAMLIEQVIINILDNSVRHGVYTTSIKINALVEKKYVSISISDNGNGIDKEKLNHLFEVKNHNEKSSDNSRGMGIGLMVCRTIIEAHGGTICAENLPSGGANFTIRLKLGGE